VPGEDEAVDGCHGVHELVGYGQGGGVQLGT